MGVLFPAVCREAALRASPRMCLREEKAECDRVLSVASECVCRAEHPLGAQGQYHCGEGK